jgi:exopolysaccharide biosynthesis polyprenyl glycosylphosphotransferase
MPKPIEKSLLLLVDFITINLAFFGLVHLRSSFDLFVEQGFGAQFQISLVIYFMWFLLFLFMGMYQSWYTQSRFDELLTVAKTVGLGVLIIFFVTFEPDSDLSQPPTVGRMMILSYAVLMLVLVGSGRLILHTIQRKLLAAGIGQRNTVILGWNKKSFKLAEKLEKYPALGYKLIGYVSIDPPPAKNKSKDNKLLGTLTEIYRIVHKYNIEQILISTGAINQKKILNVIAQIEGLPVQIKIEPDLYGTIMGLAKTQQIYGFPLIEIQPQLLKPWERKTKRFIDLAFSATVLILMLPVLILVGLAIKITSPGPVFYKQKRVGKNGRIFTIYKFRTMVKNAEKLTGPVWAGEKDPRITTVGRLLRKTRLDEFPQLINVMTGSMSLVGPRPERPYFVDRLKRQYPFYTRRLKVQPGITGWAQVKGKYDTTIENVKEKLDYDLYYIENMSLRMDIRILLFTIAVMLRFKGQ